MNEKSGRGLWKVWQRVIVTCVPGKTPACGGYDIQGKSVILELFLNMELSRVKYGKCFSQCKVNGDILKD